MSKQNSKEYIEQFGMQNFQIRWCTIMEVLPHIATENLFIS